MQMQTKQKKMFAMFGMRIANFKSFKSNIQQSETENDQTVQLQSYTYLFAFCSVKRAQPFETPQNSIKGTCYSVKL